MDEFQFDALSRRLGTFRSRRGALKAIAGAVVAGIAGTQGATAQSCTSPYSPCQADDQCCAGAVCQNGMCMPGCRIDGTFVNAWTAPSGDSCNQCLPEHSTSSWSPANEGMSCWSGDPNAGATFCQSGVCQSTGPAQCPPPPPCHTDELIDPATCTYAVAEAGTLCGGEAMCHGGFYQPADTCDGHGFCIGGGSQTVNCAPYRCGEETCTTGCATDSDCASGAHCDAGLCLTDQGLGEPCDEDSDCVSGTCADGVCCNRPCDGLCETCSTETGGYCSPVVCDDGLSCTSGTCHENTGQCVHTLESGACLINGICVTTGTVNPDNACQWCDPVVDPNAWSAVVCGDDEVGCTTTTCDPTSGCEQTLNADTCLIAGACFDDGTVNPANACEVCDPELSTTVWSAVVCGDDEVGCTTTTCDPTSGCEQTLNADTCLIAGACFDDGAVNPANACEVCDPELSTTVWSVMDLGCPNGGVCMNGACVTSIADALTDNDALGDCGCAICYRDTYTITHAGGPLQIGLWGEDGGGGTLDDPYLSLYSTFNTNCDGLIAVNDDNVCRSFDSHLNLAELSAGTYVVVASTYSGYQTGSYTLTFGQGPGC